MKLLTLPEFISVQDSDSGFEVSEVWAEHWKRELPNFLNNPDNYEHHGDCTKQPIRCVLCMLEDFLRDYREYCASGKTVKEFFDTTY